MSKFKLGDVVRLKDDAIEWSKRLYGKHITVSNSEQILPDSPYTSYYLVGEHPDDFELVVEESPNKHPHHDMIVEWVKDTSKIVQYYDDEYYDLGWKDLDSGEVTWHPELQYRFKPAEREFPKSSLTDAELKEIWDTSCFAIKPVTVLRLAADAAVKKYVLEQENRA